MKLKKKVVMRTVLGETMLVPVGKSSIEVDGVFTLTPSGAIIFDGIQKGKTESEILADILASFDGVDEETAKRDMNLFFEKMKKFDLID